MDIPAFRRKLRLFSDKKYLPPENRHVTILYPFWGKIPENLDDPTVGRYDTYMEDGKRFFELVPLTEADVAVFPAETGNWNSMRDGALRLSLEADATHKPLVVFFWSDSAEPIDVPNSIVFRTSLYGSTRRLKEFAMPAWSEDFVSKYWGGTLPIRRKREKPIVGFCGQPGPLQLNRKVRTVVRKTVQAGLRIIGPAQVRTKLKIRQIQEGPFKGLEPSSVRAKALSQLSKSTLLQTNFRFTQGHFGGIALRGGQIDHDLAKRARQNLLNNMLNSDYILCARGGGNFSYRLYETLCCGRIPIFVNTDCVLPYEEHIDWKKFCIWVEDNEIDSIDERVADLHASTTPDEFITHQYECRKFWEEWLSPLGFFSKFYLHFPGLFPNNPVQ
jgi:hypothetical protein